MKQRIGQCCLLLLTGLMAGCLVNETNSPPPAPTATPLPSTTIPEASEVNGSEADADVTFVKAQQTADGTWTFHVTVAHPDTGWEDYANGWDILLPDQTVVKTEDTPFTRELLHPHENEQPFTRSQSGISIPLDVAQVRVRAHDLVDGFGGKEVTVDLTVSSGADFEVERFTE